MKELTELPVFTYNEWKELFYKQKEMKEEFVLPEKWYIVRDKDNFETINSWAREHSIEAFYDNKEEVYYDGKKASTVNRSNIITEITSEQFKKYVLKQETMKAQLFSITGSPALLKAVWEELIALGYYQKDRIYTPARTTLISITNNNGTILSKESFQEIVCIDYNASKGVQFTLPSQYNEALAFAKAQLAPALWEKPEVKLPFADLTFTVNKSKGTATCKHGTITKSEIKAVIDAVVSPKARLLGYDLETFTPADTLIKFGCQRGILSEAQAILKALE